MAEYTGRRAPNFSQYLEDLNAIPSPYDIALQQQQQQDNFNLDSELSLFTNTEFFDFDPLGEIKIPSFDHPVEDHDNKQVMNQNADIEFLDLLRDGFGNMNDFTAPDVNSMSQPAVSMPNPQFPVMASLPNGIPEKTRLSPTQSSSSPTPPPAASVPQISAAVPAVASSTDASPVSSAPAPKRKNTQKAPPMSVEEAARIAAEEDKRRRNTAASARFRVKKKMREQALEKTVKETSEKNAALEARVTALELENQWLKNLITEKNGKSVEEGKKSESDIKDMFKQFLASHKNDGERSSAGSKIGVGTA